MTATPTHRLAAAFEPVHAVEREVSYLHDVERAGQSEWTPWIGLAGLVLFFATVIGALTALTFAAYSLGH